MMNDNELREAFDKEGYKVIKIKRWKSGEVYVTITRGSIERLQKASEFGRKLNVTVSQPC